MFKKLLASLGAGAAEVEADKRGSLFSEGRDTYGRFSVDYATVGQTDRVRQLDGWLSQVGRRRGPSEHLAQGPW